MLKRRLFETGTLGARVDERKTSRAVGGFHVARGKACLSERRRLLIARDTHDRDGCAEQFLVRIAEIPGAIAHIGQHGARDGEKLEQRVIPGEVAQIEQQGARGIGDVGGVHAPAGELVDQPAVDGAEREFAVLRAGARAGNMIEQPLRLGGGEVRIEQKTRAPRHLRLVSFGFQRATALCRAAILPDDGIVKRLARAAIPEHGRLALIGDADGGDVRRRHAFDGHAAAVERGLPDFFRIVLHPAIVGIDLAQFDGVRGDARARTVEENGPRRRRALVDGKDEGRIGVHFVSAKFCVQSYLEQFGPRNFCGLHIKRQHGPAPRMPILRDHQAIGEIGFAVFEPIERLFHDEFGLRTKYLHIPAAV